MDKAKGKVNEFLKKDKVVTGVCKRIAQKFDANVVFIRLVVFLVAFFIAFIPTIICYVVLSFVPIDSAEQSTEIKPNN